MGRKHWAMELVAATATVVALAGIGCRDGEGGGGRRATATPGRLGLDGDGRMRPSDGDRCPVCAMEVVRHRRFASAIEVEGGRAYYFCGTGCMIKSWLHPEVYLGLPRSELRRAVVREYFAGEHVDAAAVTFVVGSDVVGPMGPAIVPLASEDDVRTFRERHGGRATFRLGELDDARFEALTGKSPLPAKRRGER